jgi:dihydropyrimidine dehydrogenase (NAD+) subunit PreA
MTSPYRDILIPEMAAGCLLCADAPCRRACPSGVETDTVIRSLRFENFSGAASRLPADVPCASCADKPCLPACLKGKIGRPVPVDALMLAAATYARVAPGNVDLSIDFCGIRCENPFFLSSSVVGSNDEMVAKAFGMGWAGVAFKTVATFAANEVSPRFDALKKESVPFVGFKNIEQISERTLSENLGYIRRLKNNFPSKVIVASIMGQDEGEWTLLAELMTAAGADILECNFSCPHMAANGLGSDVGQNPELVAAYTRAARRGTHLPILAKMTPNTGNMEPSAIAAIEAGATGIAAINTIKSIMNVNLDTFSSGPDVLGRTSVGGYSGKAVKPIALRFIQAMKSHPKLAAVPISGMGGIETWRDAAEFMALGCENVQVTTAVMQYGYRIIDDLLEGMRLYLSAHGFTRVSEIVGRALPHILPPEALDRESICFPRFDRSGCVGCGRCALSCYDGGHQALAMDETTGRPVIDARRCVGCHLCLAVCPAAAISPGARVLKKSKISNVG